MIAICEAFAHLDVSVDRGRAKRATAYGGDYFSLADGHD